MSPRPILVLAAAFILLALPTGAAHDNEGLTASDITLTLTSGNDPVQEGRELDLVFLNRTNNSWFEWRIDTAEPHLILDLHVLGDFGLERAQQMVPILKIDAKSPGCEGDRTRGLCDFPLFHPFPNPRIWEAGGDARVYHREGSAGNFTLQLRIPGPVNGTLALQRDVTAPTFTIEPASNVTHYSFLRETRTDELTLGNTQVRRVGTTEWIDNPTQVFHAIQRYPVQGLAAETDHEVRTIFTDWAGNEVTSETTTIRTLATPPKINPTVIAIAPQPNATIASATATNLSARFESIGAPVPADGTGFVLFLDKKPLGEGLVINVDDANRTSGTIHYTRSAPLADGIHTVRFEVTNQEGGVGAADWVFHVETRDRGATPNTNNETPAPAMLAILGLIATLAILHRRR